MLKIKISLGQRLRHLREDFGYTQEYISTLLNVERQTYTNYENGYRTPPLESLVQLSDLFGISLDYLISGTGKESIEPVLDRSEQELILTYRHLSPINQKEIQDYIRFKLASQNPVSN